MSGIQFVTLGDRNYYNTMEILAHNLYQLYPDSTLYLYDWGLTDDQHAALSQRSNVEIVDWVDRLRRQTWLERFAVWLANVEEMYSGPLADLMVRRNPFVQRYFRRWQQYLMKEKPYCLLDCAERAPGDRLAFLDADAIPIYTIDEVFDRDFDIGVTLRQLDTFDPESDLPPINGGVIFFQMPVDRFELFVNHWRSEMDRKDVMLKEQQALSDIVAASNPAIYDRNYESGTLQIGGEEIRPLTFPCETYNYFTEYAVDGFEPATNKIIHLKGYDHAKKQYKDLIEELRLDE